MKSIYILLLIILIVSLIPRKSITELFAVSPVNLYKDSNDDDAYYNELYNGQIPEDINQLLFMDRCLKLSESEFNQLFRENINSPVLSKTIHTLDYATIDKKIMDSLLEFKGDRPYLSGPIYVLLSQHPYKKTIDENCRVQDYMAANTYDLNKIGYEAKSLNVTPEISEKCKSEVAKANLQNVVVTLHIFLPAYNKEGIYEDDSWEKIKCKMAPYLKYRSKNNLCFIQCPGSDSISCGCFSTGPNNSYQTFCPNDDNLLEASPYYYLNLYVLNTKYANAMTGKSLFVNTDLQIKPFNMSDYEKCMTPVGTPSSGPIVQASITSQQGEPTSLPEVPVLPTATPSPLIPLAESSNMMPPASSAAPATSTATGSEASSATSTATGSEASSATSTATGSGATPATSTATGSGATPATSTATGSGATPATSTATGSGATPATSTATGSGATPATSTATASPPPPASPAEYYIKHTKSQKCLNDNERALLIECQPSIGTNRWYIEPNDNLASTQYRFKNKNNTSRYLSTNGTTVDINTTPTDWKYTDNQISYDNKYFDIESNRMLLRDPTEIDSNNRIILPITNAITYPFIYLWTKGATPMALDYFNERIMLINTIVRNSQRFILQVTSTPNVYYIRHYATGLYLNLRYTVNKENNIIDPIVNMVSRNVDPNPWLFIQNSDESYTIKANIIGKAPDNIGNFNLIYTRNILAFDNSSVDNTWNFVTYKNTENMWSVNASI